MRHLLTTWKPWLLAGSLALVIFAVSMVGDGLGRAIINLLVICAGISILAGIIFVYSFLVYGIRWDEMLTRIWNVWHR